MKFGVNILNFGPGTDPSTLSGWARYAEDRGFHFAMISDHVAVTPDVAAVYPAPFYDPFTTLAWLAGLTSRIELGTSVAVLPYRHPLHTARVAANIDQFSGGRLIVGVGVSWAQQEYAALDIPFEQRGSISDEYLDIITRAWSENVVSAEGRFTFTDVQTEPLPVRTPPIWVGGSSNAAIRRTARFGQGWHPINARLDWLREAALPFLRTSAEQAGRPVPTFAPRVPINLTHSPVPDDQRLPGHGTLDQIREDLHELADLGAEYVLFDTYLGTPSEFRPPEKDQEMLDLLTDGALDLKGEALR